MLEREVFVLKGVSVVDVYHSGAVIMHEVAALYHEVLDYSVKARALESHRNAVRLVLAGTELPEVFSRLWCHISEELQDDPTDFRISNADIEKNLKPEG